MMLSASISLKFEALALHLFKRLTCEKIRELAKVKGLKVLLFVHSDEARVKSYCW